MMSEQFEQVRSLLESDRSWCAYALADLYPPHAEQSTWFTRSGAVILRYEGLEPPVLFAHGDPGEFEALAAGLPAGRYQYALLATHRALLGDRLQAEYEVRMWRMVHDREHSVTGAYTQKPLRLGERDLPEVLALFGDHPDRPDAFAPGQLRDGHTFGIRREGELVAIAGTHVVSNAASVAAVGNVFTLPEHRNQGLGGAASAAVVRSLIDAGFETIVLNVSMTNEPALACYRNLGFHPYCGYYEGVARLQKMNTNKEPS